jgi:hypothetical protein
LRESHVILWGVQESNLRPLACLLVVSPVLSTCPTLSVKGVDKLNLPPIADCLYEVTKETAVVIVIIIVIIPIK